MPISDASLDQLFRHARTANGFIDKPVAPEVLRQVYELAAMAPTSMNTQPLRITFIRSDQ